MHSNLLCPTIPLHCGIEPYQDQRSLFPLMPNKAIFCFICAWCHESLHVYSLVGGLVPESFRGLVGWYHCSSYGIANPFSFFGSCPNSSTGVLCSAPCLTVSICISIGQALAEPLRGQLYQALIRKCFLASVIMSGFGVYSWDGL